MKRKKGITLIALIITIIVLLILVGVVISTLTGNDSVIENANRATERYSNSVEIEKENLNNLNDSLEKYMPRELIATFSVINWNNGKASVTILSNDNAEDITIKYQKNGTTDGNWVEGNTVTNLDIGDIVYAFLIDRVGRKSSIEQIKIEDIEPPTAPVIGTSDVTDNAATITITTPSTDAGIGFRDYTYIVEKPDGTKIEMKNETSLSKIITGLTQKTNYDVYVMAYDQLGNEIKSNVITITTESEPRILNYATKSNFTYTLSSSSDLTNYMIPEKVFTESLDTYNGCWHSNSESNAWIRIDFNEFEKIKSFTITNREDAPGNSKYGIRSFNLQALDSSNNWITLQSFNNPNNEVSGGKFNGTVTYNYNGVGFKSYRWITTYKGYVAIGQLEIVM